MSVRAAFHTLVARVRGALRSETLTADFEEEIAAHLAAAEEDGVRRGLTPEEARREARVQLGGVAQLREAARAAEGLPGLGSSWLDVKLGVRLLARHPGLTLVSTVALAIGIAIVAGFHAGTEFMVRPVLPDAPDEPIVALWNHDVARADRGAQTLGDMLAWRRDLRAVEQVGAFVLEQRAIAAEGRLRMVDAAQISASAFEILRAAPFLGRPLVAADERPGAPAVALLGFDLWQSAMDGDPGVVGRTIRVGGRDHTVVGVMPVGFAFPVRHQLWTPLHSPAAGLQPGEGPAVELSFGRLAPNTTIEEAEAELEVIGSRWSAAYRTTHEGLRPRIAPYARSFLEANEPGLVTLMNAARVLIGLVVLIVAVNVGALVYARNAARVAEVALRLAIGATRRRIAVQMFLEGLVLAAVAGVLGLAVMAWPLHLLGEVFETGAARGAPVPYWFVVRIGPATALVVVGLVLPCAVLTGMLPALKLTDRHMRSRLQQAQAGVSGLRFGRATTAVVVAQVAISVALLTVAGAQLRTLVDDWTTVVDTGDDRSGYLSAQLRWESSSAGSDQAVGIAAYADRHARAWRALDRQVSQEPAVRGVTFDAFQGARPFETVTAATAPQWASVVLVGANYFGVQGVPVLAGRAFAEADSRDRPTAIVNEAFVRAVMPGANGVGQHIRAVDPRRSGPPGDALEIVGVVQDVPMFEISERGPAWVAHPTVYAPLVPTASTVRMIVRVRDDPQAFVPTLTAITAGIDPALVVDQPRPVETIDAIDLLFFRLYGFGVGFLVFAVLLLATAGVYSMMSFTVAQRTRELGIRTALGANPARVVRDVFRRVLIQVGAGTALGLGVGFVAANGPLAPPDALQQGPGLMAAIAGFILLTGAVACGIPLHRALRIQPTEALRAD